MRRVRGLSIVIALVAVLAFGGIALAQAFHDSAGTTKQTFVSATSESASCVNPPGPCGPLISRSITLKQNSLLTITFSARGTVSQPTAATVQTEVRCEVDGTPCKPDINGVQFLYPPFCCDTRSFTWVKRASRGPHTVTITWTTLNQGASHVQNRTLVVQAAKL
jgi:hypothetical protein